MAFAQTPDDSLPLAGLTVVALEQAVAAPLATRHLADLGARVIKIERVGE
ncbi:MAG: CoA transferase, partial [Gordonia polyisoprenivorans]|nr:CoA transferase [Gordonia polyisoprenivorans]